jgi:hypothetical protein
MSVSPTVIFVVVAVFAALALVGRLLTLFRQSKRIEKRLDYSKMKEWEDDEDDWPSR